ncbi:MAG: hypothetical protein QOE60_1160 [Thermoleophilaceae bacterium]|nr:hypothetical protein [Thermoleophilaceae bacterium]
MSPAPAGQPHRPIVGPSLVAWLGALACLAGGGTSAAGAASPIELGGADSFAVLGATTVTSAGVSAITGDIGVSPGTAVTGFGPGTIAGGALHLGDGTAATAHAGLVAAYDVAVARAPTQSVGALGTQTLDPGVYVAGAAMALDGTLTLDGHGDPGAVFVFQAGSTLNTGAGSQVALTGGTQACNVVWQVGSSATLGASSLLRGTILAHTAITVGAGVTIHGRALARDAAVTLDADTVAVPACDRGLANTAPAIAPFAATLSGVTQTVRTAVGAWSLADARGTGAGYTVTVAASPPTVDGSIAAAGTGPALTLTPRAPVAQDGNSSAPGVAAGAPQALSPTATTILSAAAGTGQGRWGFPADLAGAESLAIGIPGDAQAGAFASTLTFTTAPPAA